MIMCDYDNDTCKLLDPCLKTLLPYQEVLEKVIKSEKSLYSTARRIKNMEKLDISYPFCLLDWSFERMIYQLPNKEFIYELAKNIKDIKPETILEVGAGRGVISKLVSKILNKDIVLTDSYEWREYSNDKEKLHPKVLKKTYIEAIEEFKPDLIIASWMPHNASWTKDFRKYPFVKGYIIIGEYKGGATGSDEDWETDWKFKHLEEVEKYGICRTDHGFAMRDSMLCIRHTCTTYFERP